jgi:glycosyltransferase involved in cell wall biosynthesis
MATSPALTPLHRAWRALPPTARRAALARASAWLAPRAQWPAPKAAGGIIVGGEIGRASGLGQGARLMFAALGGLGIPAWQIEAALPVPGEATLLAPHLADTPIAAPLVLHVNAPLLPAALLRLGRAITSGRRVIGYWAWELPVVPATWHHGARFVHEIWAPSRFTAAALEPLAPGRVRVVPHPVAARPPVPAALSRADFGLPAEAIVTLVSFSIASSFERKNPLGAIAAFRAAFADRADRILVLKVLHAGHAPADIARLQACIAGAPNIRVETRLLPESDSHALTRNADIVLSLHRSEGFGLVPAEAMFLGRAIVATDYSGTTDFLDATCAMPVGYRLIPARDPRGIFEAPGAQWADPDIAGAAHALRALAEDASLRARLGAQAARAAPVRLGAGALGDAVRGLGIAVPGQTA